LVNRTILINAYTKIFRKDIGLSYTRYSSIAASALRQCIKSASGAPKKVENPMKMTQWEGGKSKKAE